MRILFFGPKKETEVENDEFLFPKKKELIDKIQNFSLPNDFSSVRFNFSAEQLFEAHETQYEITSFKMKNGIGGSNQDHFWLRETFGMTTFDSMFTYKGNSRSLGVFLLEKKILDILISDYVMTATVDPDRNLKNIPEEDRVKEIPFKQVRYKELVENGEGMAVFYINFLLEVKTELEKVNKLDTKRQWTSIAKELTKPNADMQRYKDKVESEW